MGVPNADLNIQRGRIAAFKALMRYISTGVQREDDMYVPEIATNDQRLDDVALQSYNSIRNSWIAMYGHWKYPDLFVVVQCDRGVVYTQVNKHVHREADLTQATLW